MAKDSKLDPRKFIGDLYMASFVAYKEQKISIAGLLKTDLAKLLRRATGAASNQELAVTIPTALVKTGVKALASQIPVVGSLAKWAAGEVVGSVGNKVKEVIAKRVTKLPAGIMAAQDAVNYDTLGEIEQAMNRLKLHIPAFNANYQYYLDTLEGVDQLKNPTQADLTKYCMEVLLSWQHVYVSGVKIIQDIIGMEAQLRAISELASEQLAPWLGGQALELQDGLTVMLGGKVK